ncbi:MAG: hypothetical protein ACKVH8_11250 [Pirellulales bacterium]
MNKKRRCGFTWLRNDVVAVRETTRQKSCPARPASFPQTVPSWKLRHCLRLPMLIREIDKLIFAVVLNATTKTGKHLTPVKTAPPFVSLKYVKVGQS